MALRPEWEGFNPDGLWTSEINVRDFIQANYTEYDGDQSFLAGPTAATKKLFDELQKLQKAEHDKVSTGLDGKQRTGVLDMDTDVVSGLTSHPAAYICPEGKELEYYVQEVPVADYQEPEYAMDPSASEDNDTEPEVKPNEADRAMNKEYVINRPINAVSLPSTGGPGTKLFYGMGISLMTFAGIFFFIKRSKCTDRS